MNYCQIRNKIIQTNERRKNMRTENKPRVRIPLVQNLDNAILIYYANSELTNSDICSLFGKKSSATVARLKDLARVIMSEKGIEVLNNSRVNTKAAFEAWGLDIADMEERQKKIIQLKKRMSSSKE